MIHTIMPVMPASDQQMPPFLKICDNLFAHTRVCAGGELLIRWHMKIGLSEEI